MDLALMQFFWTAEIGGKSAHAIRGCYFFFLVKIEGRENDSR
jgi:hypothetical protein